MKCKVRFIDHIGTPGVIEHHDRNALEDMLTGSKSIVYIDHVQVPTDPLIIPDNYTDITVVNVPEGTAYLIAAGVVFLAGAIWFAIDATNTYIQGQAQIPDTAAPRRETAFSIRGSRNTLREDGRVPILLGNVRITPDWVGIPYTGYIANEQYYYQLFCFGYSNMTLSDLRIGANDIDNYVADYAEDLTYFPELISPNAINVELVASQALTYTTPAECYQVTYGIAFYSGLREYDDSGTASDYSVSFQVRYRELPSGAWVSDTLTITGNADYIREQNTIVFPANGLYEVEITRTTADSSETTIIDRSHWDFLNSYIESPDTGTSPISTDMLADCKVFSLRIKATSQLNQVIDSLNGVAQARYRDWNGLGSGSAYWIAADTRNPASALLYLLTDSDASRKPQGDSIIQWDEFEAFWTWCDTKGFYFDLCSSDYTTGQIVSFIEMATRSKLTYFSGKWGIVIDEAKTNIDFVLTPRNTAGAMVMNKPFGAKTKNLECTFVDRDSDFVRAVRTVSLDSGGNIQWDTPQAGETEQINFIGITDADHMAKIAAFTLAVYLRRNISFTVPQDFEALTAYPGAVGRLANDMFLYALNTAKITGISGTLGAYTGITIDANVTFEVGKSYSVLVRLNTSDMGQIINLTNPETTTNFLEFSAPSAFDIDENNLVTFGLQGANGLKVICKEVQRDNEQSGSLSLVPYAEEVFTADSGTIPAFDSGITKRPEGGTGLTEEQILLTDISNRAASNTLTPTTYTWIKYSANADGTDLTDAPVPDSTLYIGVATNKLSPVESTDKTAYTWSRYVGDGGYSVQLKYPTYSFSATNTGYVSKVTIENEVFALIGGDVVDIVISKLDAPTGMTITQTGTLITMEVEGSLLADSGSFTIPVQIFVPISGYAFGRDPDVYGRNPKVYGRTVNDPNATSFELTFSWAKSKEGIAGADGNGVEYVYKLTTTSTPPATPTGGNTEDDYVPAGWTDDPTGVDATNLYEWVSQRTGTTGNWGDFAAPAIWAKYGETGAAGADGINAPKYLGKYLGSSGHPGTRDEFDFWLIYDTSDSPIQRGIWQDQSGTPTRIANDTGANSPLFSQPLGDILWAVNSGTYGSISDYGSIDYISALVANSAFIAQLGVQTLTLATGGAIKSSNYSATPGSEAGFNIDGDTGSAVFNDVSVRGGGLFGAISSEFIADKVTFPSGTTVDSVLATLASYGMVNNESYFSDITYSTDYVRMLYQTSNIALYPLSGSTVALPSGSNLSFDLVFNTPISDTSTVRSDIDIYGDVTAGGLYPRSSAGVTRGLLIAGGPNEIEITLLSGQSLNTTGILYMHPSYHYLLSDVYFQSYNGSGYDNRYMLRDYPFVFMTNASTNRIRNNGVSSVTFKYYKL